MKHQWFKKQSIFTLTTYKQLLHLKFDSETGNDNLRDSELLTGRDDCRFDPMTCLICLSEMSAVLLMRRFGGLKEGQFTWRFTS